MAASLEEDGEVVEEEAVSVRSLTVGGTIIYLVVSTHHTHYSQTHCLKADSHYKLNVT